MSRFPSVRTLEELFKDNAKEARKIIDTRAFSSNGTLSKRLWKYKSVQNRVNECWRMPSWLDLKMTALNELGEFSGTEAMQHVDGEEYAEYLNAGDSYVATLIFWRGHWRVQSIGDFVEVMGRRSIRFK